MVNKNNFFKNFWKKEWFSFSLTLLIFISSYAFYQLFPFEIKIIAISFPIIIVLVYLYFIFFFKFKISLSDYYKLRDISIGFLAMIYFSLSLFAVSYKIDLKLWLFLFLGFYIIYLSSLFFKYFKNKILAKFISLSGLLIALLSILPNFFIWPIIILIIFGILILLFLERRKLKS